MSQFDDVNVNGAPTCASPESLEYDRITTSDTGSASSTTVNCAVVPVSATDTEVVDNVNPAGTAVPRLPDESSLKTNTS